MNTAHPRLLNGLSELAPDIDGFVLDLWGVMHDGVQPYPGAIDCLEQIQKAGKRAVFLSNAPRRVQAVIDHLSRNDFSHLSQNSLWFIAGLAQHIDIPGRSAGWPLHCP